MAVDKQRLHEAVYSRGRELGRTGIYGAYDKFMRVMIHGFAWLLVMTPITGNQLSILGIISNLVAAGFFTAGTLHFSLLALLLLVLGELFDWVDGTVARYRGEATKIQADFLGRSYHIMTLAFLFAGIGLGVYNTTGNIFYLLLGFWAALMQQTTAYFLELKTSLLLTYRHYLFQKPGQVTKAIIGTKNKDILVRIFVFPIDYLWIKPILLLGVVVNILDWLLIFYAIYLSIRALVFFFVSYYTLKKIENK